MEHDTGCLNLLIQELQRKGRQRAEELAVTFEVSKRTIYRDMQALSEAGVPIIAIQKKGYSLAGISYHLCTLPPRKH